jgi:hypothetical protein
MKKVFTFLMTAATLLLISIGVMAQGGATPYLNSTHTYTVEMEDGVNNTAQWIIADDEGTALDPQPTFATNVDGNIATLEITWTTVGSFKVQFSETNPSTACVTAKELDVTVSANTFDVTAVTSAATCNAADGVVNYVGTEVTTEVSFVVDMETADSGFNPNWEFTFTLTSTTGATIGNVTDGTNILTPDGSNIYTLTGLTSADGTGSITIFLDATGELYTAEDVVLTITSAKELTYNTPDVDSDDWAATQTINPIPQTSDISTD